MSLLLLQQARVSLIARRAARDVFRYGSIRLGRTFGEPLQFLICGAANSLRIRERLAQIRVCKSQKLVVVGTPFHQFNLSSQDSINCLNPSAPVFCGRAGMPG